MGLNAHLSMPLPVTALALLPFTLLHTALAGMAIAARAKTNTYFGTSSSSKNDSPSSDAASSNEQEKRKRLSGKSPITAFDPMEVACRAHSNFTENAPLGLICAAVVEMNGGDRTTLGWLLAAFWGVRVAHAVGLFRNLQPLRATGFMGSLACILGLGGWGMVLGWSNLGA